MGISLQSQNQLKTVQTKMKDTESNICQIAVIKDGSLVLSETYNGYSKDECCHIASATKSIVGLLVGIAVDQGKIGSIDDKVLSYFPEYVPKRGEKTIQEVTVRHLLTMRAPYKGKGDPWTKVCSSPDWTNASLDFLGGRKGLTDEFDYRTVCLHILSGILHRATGMTPQEYAGRFLFSPLGIAPREDFYAANAQEHVRFTIDKSPKGKLWFVDPQGLGTPGYGLCMSAEEMCRIGQLCLQKGEYAGKRVVSESWVDAMTRPREAGGPMFRGMSYGYLWWVIHPDDNIYAAIGDSGNVIYVSPKENIVVAVSSFFKPSVMDRVDFIESFIEKNIL